MHTQGFQLSDLPACRFDCDEADVCIRKMVCISESDWVNVKAREALNLCGLRKLNLKNLILKQLIPKPFKLPNRLSGSAWKLKTPKRKGENVNRNFAFDHQPG